MRLIDHQYNLDMLVHIEESLHEERVADLDLFAIVIFEARTIVEAIPSMNNLGRNVGLQ